MHIKVFDNFSLGKLGGKNKKDSPAEITARASRIADMETKINGKTKDLKKATEKLNGLRTDAGIAIPVDVIPVRPHGPAAELTLEPEDLSDNSGIALDEVISDEPVTLGGDIKIAEVSAEKIAAVKAVPVAAAALPVEEKKEEKQDEADSLNNLFSQDEEEENPLASLINSLPDVTVRELMDDLAEIHRIIKEWRPSSKRTF
jgi:hypothetical protein